MKFPLGKIVGSPDASTWDRHRNWDAQPLGPKKFNLFSDKVPDAHPGCGWSPRPDRSQCPPPTGCWTVMAVTCRDVTIRAMRRSFRYAAGGIGRGTTGRRCAAADVLHQDRMQHAVVHPGLRHRHGAAAVVPAVAHGHQSEVILQDLAVQRPPATVLADGLEEEIHRHGQQVTPPAAEEARHIPVAGGRCRQCGRQCRCRRW